MSVETKYKGAPHPSVAADESAPYTTRILALGNFHWFKHPLGGAVFEQALDDLQDGYEISETASRALLAMAPAMEIAA